jgi:hypothetical protein
MVHKQASSHSGSRRSMAIHRRHPTISLVCSQQTMQDLNMHIVAEEIMASTSAKGAAVRRWHAVGSLALHGSDARMRSAHLHTDVGPSPSH